MDTEKDYSDLFIHPSDLFTITDLETLKVVTDPLRLKILNLLRSEPRTVKRSRAVATNALQKTVSKPACEASPQCTSAACSKAS